MFSQKQKNEFRSLEKHNQFSRNLGTLQMNIITTSSKDDIADMHAGENPLSGSINMLQREARLIKSSILYADQVLVSSYHIFLRSCILEAVNSDNPHIILYAYSRYLKQHAAYNSDNDPNRQQSLQLVEDIQRQLQTDNNLKKTYARPGIRKTIESIRKNLRELMSVDEIEMHMELTGIDAALRSGHVKIQQFDKANIFDQFDQTEEQTSRTIGLQMSLSVSQALSQGNVHPLFDKTMYGYISELLSVGSSQVASGVTEKAKECAVASNLLDRLPNFEKASIKQLLDIRKELNGPLVMFRKGIINFSKNIESAPWDVNFENEAGNIFRQEIEPAIADIEIRVQQNKYMSELLGDGLNVAEKMPALVAMVSPFIALPFHIPAVTVGAGLIAGGMALSAYQNVRKKDLENQKNEMYFYVKARQKMGAIR